MILGMGYTTREVNVAAAWIAMFIFVPLSVVTTAILVFIVLPLMGVHISFNDAVELFLYASYLAIIMPLVYLAWKTVKQR